MSYHHTTAKHTELHLVQSCQIAQLLGISVERALAFPERKTEPDEITRCWKPQEQAQYILDKYLDIQAYGIIGYGDHHAGFRHQECTELLHTLGRRIQPLLGIACGKLDFEDGQPEALWTALRRECESLWSIVDTLRYPAVWHHDCHGLCLLHWHSLWDRIANIADVRKEDRYGIAYKAEMSRKEIFRDLYCRAEQLGFIARKRSLADRLVDVLVQRSPVLRWIEVSDEDVTAREAPRGTP